MIPHIRIATPEEVEAVRHQSDLEMPCSVWAMDNSQDYPDLAVTRTAFELDPVHFGPKTTTVGRARFIYALEERMAGAGIKAYYFNVAASDETWQRTIEDWGAQRVSPGPELRFKKIL